MAEILVQDFRQKVKEILPGVEPYPSFGSFAYEWKTDNKLFRIFYNVSISTKRVTIFSYVYEEYKPTRHAVARNYNTGSYFRITVGRWPGAVKAEFELDIDEVPDIFTDGDTMLLFIADVRDNGIRAFADIMERLASRHGQSFTIRV